MSKMVYLDYAATTPVAPEVERAMRPYLGKIFGNPGSVHWFGQEASAAVFKARQTIAQAIGADWREIVFTGSATEANNLALRGITNYQLPITNEIPNSKFQKKIIISAIEHESVLETARDLEKQEVEVIYLPVDKNGSVNLKKLKAALDEKTILVSIQYANSEVGTIQPIAEIAKVIRNFHKSQITNHKSQTLFFHTDAVQASQFLDCDIGKLGVDLMTLSAHKIYGPKGIGALYIRSLNPSGYTLNPLITGGGQEFGLRSGTENVAGIVGFGAAVELNQKSKIKNQNLGIGKLRDYLWQGIKEIMPSAQLNGPDIKSNNRLPNNLNIYFPGRPAQDLTIELDLWGISVSPGTACSARSADPSHVIKALGYGGDRPKSSLRLTLGRPTTKAEIDCVLTIFRKRFL